MTSRMLVMAIVLAVGGCGQEAGMPAGDSTAAAPSDEAAGAPAMVADEIDPASAVLLRGDGVVLASGERIPFGTPAEQTVGRLTAAFGTGPDQRQALEDCGEGPLEMVGWDNGFAAYLQQHAFVGWTAIDQRTEQGIGWGSTRAELDAAYAPEVFEGSLGAEFNVGGFTGFLESTDPDAQVSDFRAGMTCLMR